MFLQINLESICSLCFDRRRAAVIAFLLLIALPQCFSKSRSQFVQDIPAPPPLKVVPANELSQLSATRDLKNRVRMSLEFANGHLDNAEKYTNASDFDGASVELGKYRAVYEEALKYLDDLHDRSNHVRDSYKRIELALREEGPRIETIRRTTPREYAVNIKTLADYTRDAREQALNSFYGDTVLREPRRDPKPRDSDHVNIPTPAENSKKP